jgi:hypothetical protein
MEKNNELLDEILSLQADNKIAFMTIDGLHSGPIDVFVNQHLEGQLYDVNRDRATLYAMANENKNKRWINDLALVYMYEYANKVIENQRKEIFNLKSELEVVKKDLENAQKSKVVEPSVTTETKNDVSPEPITTNVTVTRKNYRMGDEHVQNISFQI